MPLFNYKATNSKGTLIQGSVSASSKREAEGFIEDKDLKVVMVKEQKKGRITLFSRGGFPIAEKISLCRYLALIINSGLSIGEGLDLLANGTVNKTVRQVVEDVASSTRRGTSLYTSFSKYEKYFGPVFLTIIKTGEASGSLAESFSYMGNQFEQEKEIHQKVFGALLYPVIIIGLMLAVGTLLFIFVLPRLAVVFKTMNVKMPALTKFMFDLSLSVQKHTIPVIGGAIVLFIIIFLFFKSHVGHKLFMWVFVRLPIVRTIVKEYNLVRFSQSLCALLKSAVPVTQAVELSTKSLSFVNNAELVAYFDKSLTKGITLSACFSKVDLFPPVVIQLIAIGEKTGSLEKILSDLSTFYEKEIENTLKNMTTILEPFLMIFVGIGVGIMVVSIISPIYSLIGQMSAGM